MSELSKQYSPKEHESETYKRWEDAGVFQPSEEALQQGKEPFVVTLPPPNITGNLHMGHALNSTIQDVMVRYYRMQGQPSLWIPGTDHAGIATQNVVEKELRKEGKDRHDIGREKFLERVWQWREQYGDTIIGQLKKLGASCDWSRISFTMDPAYAKAVQHTFVEYYKRGFIYRGNRIVNWCPRCASVISDLEIKRVEQTGMLVTLRYPLKDGSGHIEVATTRPETMLGDTAVAVNPADERYTQLVGKTVLLPIMDREIPIVADERVDSSFGTGAVKITPAHDPLDAEIGETHHLPIINVIGEDGKMTAEAGEYARLAVTEARDKVLAQLQKLEAVVAQEEHRLNITLCDRCGTTIEPLISRQWFVAMGKLKNETMEVVRNDLIEFHPPRWKDQLLRWMDNVHDWTISRQLWWGHQVPVWWKSGTRGTTNEEGNYVVSAEKPEGEGWEQDPDVLDTWFSSALWPFATLGWPEQTDDLRNYYPTSLLSTARDILYLWVARMIFSGLELVKEDRPEQTQRIPFKAVLIHPTVLNKKGQRMSKSLGTGVDPLELIDQYGADATRFGLMYQMSYDSQAIRFDEASIASARNFANKIWNLGRFLTSLPDSDEETIADHWIQKRCDDTIDVVTKLIEGYKLGEAAHVLQDFVWKDFADWYVEILKVKGSKKVALAIYERLLALLHPFMPHVTEVLWQSLGHSDLLIVSPWPSVIAKESVAMNDMEYFQNIVMTVRSARTLLNVPPSATINLWVKDPVLTEALKVLARVNISPVLEEGMTKFPMSNGESLGLSSEHITADSLAQARVKLSSLSAKLSELITRTSAQLENMREKAPAAVIQEKEKVIAESKKQLEEIEKSQGLLN